MTSVASTVGLAAVLSLGVAAAGWATSCEIPLSQHVVQAHTQQQGLPLDAVYAVTEDQENFVWVGTEDGLAQFDGRHFERIDLSRILGDAAEFIERLTVTPDGDLLAATANAGIVSAAGGTIRVSSEPGKGTRFSVVLPLDETAGKGH